MRVYESLGGKARGVLEVDLDGLGVKKVEKCNLLEDEGVVVEGEKEGGRWKVQLRAFEVATYRLWL